VLLMVVCSPVPFTPMLGTWGYQCLKRATGAFADLRCGACLRHRRIGRATARYGSIGGGFRPRRRRSRGWDATTSGRRARARRAHGRQRAEIRSPYRAKTRPAAPAAAGQRSGGVPQAGAAEPQDSRARGGASRPGRTQGGKDRIGHSPPQRAFLLPGSTHQREKNCVVRISGWAGPAPVYVPA